MRLDEILGQDPAVTVLRRALAAGRLAHAYLFEGPEGIGKRSTALALALALNCPDSPSVGCGRCEVCRRIEEGLHPDVRVVSPAGSWIVVDEVRPIVALAATRPHEAPARLILVDPADRMNAAAANCLLKTLEEPAAGTHIVLVTAAPARLLPTIRSRAQRVRFRRLDRASIERGLEKLHVDGPLATTAAALANGSMSRALDLATTDGASGPLARALAACRAAHSRDATGVLDAAATLGDKDVRADLPVTLAIVGRMIRDAVCLATDAADLIVLREQTDTLRDLARMGVPALTRAGAAVTEAEAALAGNANALLTIERMLLCFRREAANMSEAV